MATPSTLPTLGTSRRVKGCIERAALHYQIALLRDRLPPHEATSLEIVHLEQVLGRMTSPSCSLGHWSAEPC
jgi:hypothetical protein